MLSKSEHKEFSKLLWELGQRYPDRSYIKIIYDARKFCKPFSQTTPSNRVALEVLQKYHKKD